MPLLRALLSVLVLLALAPGTARADEATSVAIVRDCLEDGTLDGSYSPAQLAQALRDVPTDVAEYYAACVDQIRRAVLGPDRPRPAGGSNTGSSPPTDPGPATSTPAPAAGPLPLPPAGTPAATVLATASPAQRAQLTEAAAAAGRALRPGSAARPGFSVEVMATPLPTPVLLVVLGLAGAVAAGVTRGPRRGT